VCSSERRDARRSHRSLLELGFGAGGREDEPHVGGAEYGFGAHAAILLGPAAGCELAQ
jgi:hypothetical protein